MEVSSITANGQRIFVNGKNWGFKWKPEFKAILQMWESGNEVDKELACTMLGALTDTPMVYAIKAFNLNLDREFYCSGDILTHDTGGRVKILGDPVPVGNYFRYRARPLDHTTFKLYIADIWTDTFGFQTRTLDGAL